MAEGTHKCPTCGSSEHPNTAKEIEKISKVFRKLEDESKTMEEIPSSFAREEERLKSNLEDLLAEKTKLQNRFDLLRAKDKKTQEEFQNRKQMFIFLGHLKASTETFERISDGGEFQKSITPLESEYQKLLKIVDRKELQKRIDASTKQISQLMLEHLKSLDVEDKYRKIAPNFCIKNLSVSVLSNDGHWHFLAEVGSASNWVAFHIALMCALQEYFLDLKISCVPNFVIFDQPSQVYFPKIKHGNEPEDIDLSEDAVAVRSMFQTLATSVSLRKGAWQCIVLDHADKTIYGDIANVHEVEEWRKGKKLIPQEWYQ